MSREELIRQTFQDEVNTWRHMGMSEDEIIGKLTDRYIEALGFAQKLLELMGEDE